MFTNPESMDLEDPATLAKIQTVSLSPNLFPKGSLTFFQADCVLGKKEIGILLKDEWTLALN